QSPISYGAALAYTCIFSENHSVSAPGIHQLEDCKATQCRQAPGPRRANRRRWEAKEGWGGGKKGTREEAPPFNQVRSGNTGAFGGPIYPATVLPNNRRCTGTFRKPDDLISSPSSSSSSLTLSFSRGKARGPLLYCTYLPSSPLLPAGSADWGTFPPLECVAGLTRLESCLEAAENLRQLLQLRPPVDVRQQQQPELMTT
ncbi:hypothetical protein CORC01_05997, partial [Colletotrichum orchidophilum]